MAVDSHFYAIFLTGLLVRNARQGRGTVCRCGEVWWIEGSNHLLTVGTWGAPPARVSVQPNNDTHRAYNV